MPELNRQCCLPGRACWPRLGVLLVALLVAPAQAAPVVYAGTLGFGSSFSGSLKEGNVTDPAKWDLWRFSAPAGRLIELTVQRQDGAMDPLMGLWSGLETDTDAFANPADLPGKISAGTATILDTGLSRDGLNSSNIGIGDDQLPPAVPGPFGDPRITASLGGGGDFTVAVADWGRLLGFGSPRDFGYSIALRDITPVPLPPSLGLWLLAVLMLPLFARRRS